MARYDWFIRSCNKISSANSYLIGRNIYIITNDYKLVSGIVMDAGKNILTYKILDAERNPHYYDVLIKRKNREWFLSKELAEMAQLNAKIEAKIAARECIDNIEDGESSDNNIISEDY